jgi:hypothetical protein
LPKKKCKNKECFIDNNYIEHVTDSIMNLGNALVACAAVVGQCLVTVRTCLTMAIALCYSFRVLAVCMVTHACTIDAVLVLIYTLGWP